MCGIVAGACALLAAALVQELTAAVLVGLVCAAFSLWLLEKLAHDARALIRRPPTYAAQPVLAVPLALTADGVPSVASHRLLLLPTTVYVATRAVMSGLSSSRAGLARADVTRIALVASDEEVAELYDAVAHGQSRTPVAPVAHLSTSALPADQVAARLLDLPQLCRRGEVDLVLVGREAQGQLLGRVLQGLAPLRVPTAPFDAWFEEQFRATPLAAVDPGTLCAPRQETALLQRVVGRVGTLTVSLPLLLVLLVVLPVVAGSILLDSGRPILFRQRRVGLHGRTFDIVKFRTMRQDAEASGARFAAKNDPRTTRVGRLLRRTRVDELPQVFNMIRGDMALIGPRPERPEFVAQYAAALPGYDARHLIRPGVTGWAQVTEGYTSSLRGTARKLERDLFYLRHRSGRLNALILARTCSCMVRLSGR